LQKGAAVGLPRHARLVARDGKETPVEGYVAPVYDERACFTGFVLTFRDATGRRPAEGERPRQDMETVGRLAAGMAHDFNQLLTAILGNLALALSSLPKADPNRECLIAAEKAAAHAAEVVKQLFRFSREAGLRREPLDLNGAVEEMVAFLS